MHDIYLVYVLDAYLVHILGVWTPSKKKNMYPQARN